ncbi:MAG: uroporphyrinogen decarboxylase family protein [Marinilabiliaceae bacterium]|jgi:uroporphyrinogen decarboxylase|nr:uroporphyrinogen decarboxylase family protein [Marinilabiliaceae bacterium]
MTGYERIKAALAGRETDKIPIMLHNFMMAAKEAGFSMQQFRESPENIASAFIKSVEKYQYDGILVDIDTVTLAGACGVNVDFPVDEPARSHGGFMHSYDMLPTLKAVDVGSYRYVQVWLEAVRLLKEHFGNEIYVRGNCDQAPFSLASMIRGTENWMMDFYITEEKLVFELLDYCTEATSQFIKLMTQTGCDMVSNGDSPAGPAMIPADLYEKFAKPYTKKVVDVAHKEDLEYVLHICGNTNIIIEHMIETGADGLELDYKTDVHLAFDLMKDRCTLFGNVDPSGVLALGTPEQVRKETLELLDVFSGTNRFVLNSGCALPSSTTPGNIEMFIKTAREYK